MTNIANNTGTNSKNGNKSNSNTPNKLKGKGSSTSNTNNTIDITNIFTNIQQLNEKLSIIHKELHRIDKDIGHRVIAISETVGVVQEAAQKLLSNNM